MRGDAKHCPGSDVFADGTPAVCPFITRQCIQRITVAEENGWHPVSQVHESSSDDERLLPSHHPDLPHQSYLVVKKVSPQRSRRLSSGQRCKIRPRSFC